LREDDISGLIPPRIKIRGILETVMKKVFILLSFLALFLFFATESEASLLRIDNQGGLVWTVLGSEDLVGLNIPKTDELAIKSVEAEGDLDSRVNLTKSGDKVELNVASQDGERTLDVSGLSGDLVEIEERPSVRTVRIGIRDGRFAIEQGGAVALTDYSINIDPKSAELSISTPSGKHYLAVLPLEAVETALRAKILNRLSETMNLGEESAGQVAYQLEGERVINLFNIINLNVPVKTSVSVATGEVLMVEQPTWLKILGFLFT
jgi:hypothetical protein